MGNALVILGVVITIVFFVAFWGGSERQYEQWRNRRGEDEPRERHDDRGQLRRHWGGWGRPGQ